MRKTHVYVLLSIILSSVIIGIGVTLLLKYTFFNYEDLKGDCVNDTHISIAGDYIFYESKSKLLGIAKNLKNGEKKIVGIGLYNVGVHDDEIYYFAQRSPNPESYFCKRGIKSVIESRVTPSRASTYKFDKNFLYYQKHAYSTDTDGHESGYIYRMNFNTKQTEKLVDLRTRGFDIVNDTIYYTRHSKKGYEQYGELLSDGIFSCSLVNEEEKLIVDGWIGNFAVHGNNIVYTEDSDNEDNSKYYLSWLKLNSDETIKISNDATIFRLYNDNICYMEKKTPDVINILNCSTGNETSVVVKNIDKIYGFVLYENRVFYYDKNHNLCDVTF